MVSIRTFRDSYLYTMKNGSKSSDSIKNDRMLIEYINGCERIDKRSQAFAGIIEDVKRQQNSSVLLNILLNPNVEICTYKFPLPPAFKVFDAKDIKNNKKHTIFVDMTELLKIAPGYDYYTCKRIDIFVCYLFSALSYLLYRNDTGMIMANSNIMISGAECYSNLFTYIIDYLRILGFSASKNKVKYLASLFYLCTVCQCELGNHTKNISAKIAKITPTEMNAYDLYIQDTDFTNIATFIDSITKQFNLKGLTLEVFVRRWIMSFGNGTQYALELFPSFSTMITSAYTGAYIVNQKQIEASCANSMITFTRALLAVSNNVYGIAREAFEPAKRKDAIKLGYDMKKEKPRFKKKDFTAMLKKESVEDFCNYVVNSLVEYYNIPGNDLSRLSKACREVAEMDLDVFTESIINDDDLGERHEDIYKGFTGLFDQTDSVKVLDKIRSCAGQIQDKLDKDSEFMPENHLKGCTEGILYLRSLEKYIY